MLHVRVFNSTFGKLIRHSQNKTCQKIADILKKDVQQNIRLYTTSYVQNYIQDFLRQRSNPGNAIYFRYSWLCNILHRGRMTQEILNKCRNCG